MTATVPSRLGTLARRRALEQMGTTGVSCGLGVAVVRDKLRAFALSLPEALEDHPWDEDVVKVRGKIFVFLGSASSERMTVKLEESHSHALSIDGAAPTGYGLGASGWVTVPLRADGITIALLRDWVEESYRIVAPKRLLAEIDAAL